MKPKNVKNWLKNNLSDDYKGGDISDYLIHIDARSQALKDDPSLPVKEDLETQRTYSAFGADPVSYVDGMDRTGLIDIGKQMPEEMDATEDDSVDSMQKKVEENEKGQPDVSGYGYLDFMSGDDSDKAELYGLWKSENPEWNLMSPVAKNVYNEVEIALRQQYNIERMNPNSSWYQGGGTGKDYLAYIRAALNPADNTAYFWNNEYWQRNLEELDSYYRPTPEMFDPTEGADIGEPSAIRSQSVMFDVYAANPAVVTSWIAHKATKGMNPFERRYAKEAVLWELWDLWHNRMEE